MGVVIENINRAERKIVDAFEQYGVATIHEAQGRKGLMASYMNPIYQGAHISGTAVTVSLPPCDNWMIHVAAEQCREGDILVVAPTSFSDAGYFGDLLGTLFMALGVKGVVLDAGCRDIKDLKEMGFPVWSKCISATGTVKETIGSVNISVACAGQTVNAGDIIVADDDGVVVVEYAEAEAVVEKCRVREENEAVIRELYKKGELGLDRNNWRPVLQQKGLKYIKEPLIKS